MMKENAKHLTAYFQPQGFIVNMDPVVKKGKVREEDEQQELEWFQRLQKDKYTALYHMGFLVRQDWMSPSITYLHRISELLIRRLSQQPDLELMRQDTFAPLSQEDLALLKDEVPFVHGTEFVTKE